MSLGSKYTSFTRVPPMSIPNQGKAAICEILYAKKIFTNQHFVFSFTLNDNITSYHLIFKCLETTWITRADVSLLADKMTNSFIHRRGSTVCTANAILLQNRSWLFTATTAHRYYVVIPMPKCFFSVISIITVHYIAFRNLFLGIYTAIFRIFLSKSVFSGTFFCTKRLWFL